MSVSLIKDLRNSFAEVRDQGQRPTCMVFAASDAHAQARGGEFELLSTEYLYHNAVHLTTPPRYGLAVSLASTITAIKWPGQPLESAWPYLANTPKPSDWNPPAVTDNYQAEIAVLPNSPHEIIRALDQDITPIITLNITHAFHIPDKDGIVAVVSGDPVTGHHAVVAVGYGTIAASTVLLVRNSWGVDWGLAGYAWLHEDYASKHARSISVATSLS